LCREKRVADLLAQAVIQPRSGSGESFFQQAAVSFVSALFMYTATEMTVATPATSYRLLVEGGVALLERFGASEVAS